MSIYRIAEAKLEELRETTFSAEDLQERQDLQRLIKADISILGKDLKVLAEEFHDWEDSNRRIDLLCIDTEARLVVVELKRTEDGGHLDLQAIRYAAMVSSMTLENAVSIYAQTLDGEDALQRVQRAKSEILSFLGWEEEGENEFNRNVRIILVSGDFSVEITTAVLWLNNQGLDITCVRTKPYKLGSDVLIDVQQIIPLPEAAIYVVKIRAHEQENKKARSANEATWSGAWYANVGEDNSRSWEDMRLHGFIAAGGGLRWIRPLQKLKLGDEVYVYQSGRGYVGYGAVAGDPLQAKDFKVNGTNIAQLPLQQPGLLHDLDDPELTEWVVPIKWYKAFPLSEAKTFPGAFANPASVCKLRHSETLKFLRERFLND